MYEALVARVRYHIQKANFMGLKEADSTLILGETADAIEELVGFVQEAERDRDEYRERLDNANELMQKRWIPVTERLPNEMVLAHGRDGDIRSLEYSFTKKWWEDDVGYYCDTNYVTHWMPLPEPPTAEEGE